MMDYTRELELSLHYLNSNAALKSIEVDPYWPKWDSPWWHMLLLHEMNLSAEIPETIISAFIAALNRVPLKIFPIHPGDLPEGVDRHRGSPCHCQLGNVYQVLAVYGVDVDRELPWIRPWFLRYQMADGGLSCDGHAYLVEGETPSSMVGTIGAFEAILNHTKRPWTTDELSFLKRGAEFLMGRRLMRGSPTLYNAEERTEAEEWLRLCFPRFYFYDVLRGLNALLSWAEKTQSSIPAESVESVVKYLGARFPDSLVKNARLSYTGTGTILQNSSGEWMKEQDATLFPLLQKVSVIDEFSPFLSKRWGEAQALLRKHDHLKVFVKNGSHF